MALKNILVTNDDGITSRGIHVLANALLGIASVYVCAPDRQRTAAGHGITVSEDIFIKEEDFEGAEKAYACSGTPADCVKMGLRLLRRQGVEVDMVCSGVNHGANLGTDVLYSGTVSAALEGAINGVPSVAFSCCSHEAVHMEAFQRLVPDVCKAAFRKLEPHIVLNVNVPDVPPELLQGIRFTRQGMREYDDTLDVQGDLREGIYCGYSGAPLAAENLPEDMDTEAWRQNYITITPLQFDLTAHSLISELAGWGISFSETDKK